MRRFRRQLEELQTTIKIAYFLFSILLVVGSEIPGLRYYAILSCVVLIVVSWRRQPYNRARKLQRNGGGHTYAEWIELKQLYGNRCASCGNSGRLTKDHILPVSRGGTDDIKNIQPLCASCNSSKGTKIIVY